jgi:hypothetical protein
METVVEKLEKMIKAEHRLAHLERCRHEARIALLTSILDNVENSSELVSFVSKQLALYEHGDYSPDPRFFCRVISDPLHVVCRTLKDLGVRCNYHEV